MTAPVTDLLDSVLDAFPGELALRKRGTGLVLEITSPVLSGSLFASSRAELQGIAMAYERMRNAQRFGPRRCACDALYAEHVWDASGKRRGACPDGTGTYTPQEDMALAAGQGNQDA